MGLTTRASRTLAAWVAHRPRRLAGAAGALLVGGLAAVAVLAVHAGPEGGGAAGGDRSTPSAALPRPAATAADATDAPARPERPPDLERSDERGAAAAAVYVLELEPYGLHSGDWRDFAALCSARSSWCRDKTASMRLVAAGEVRYDGCATDVRGLRTTPTDAPDTFVVTVVQRQAACVRHALAASADGGVDVYGGNHDPDATPDLIDVTVRHGSAGWQVLRASLA
ncbi:DUF6318 family protein [Luteimicrobium sp. DT211]|uniref:DUF6318 family protein n=1 Tax=Luteimicrobium sp. DT211 TaxID=3393412 RepID=UPI003CFA8F3E